MTLVPDASALVAALLNRGRLGSWAEATLTGQTLACPEVALAEATNTLRRMEQAGEITREQAASAYRGLLAFDLDLRPFRPFAERVWELRHNLTSYDAWYVALAEALDCPLVTLDHRLSRSPGPTCAVLTPPGEHG